MKLDRITSLLFVIILLHVFSCRNSDVEEVFEYVILMEENETTDSLTYEAAKVVKHYYQEVTGKDISISASLNPGEKAICVGGDFLQLGLQDSIKDIHEDGFVIEVKDGNVVILGQNGKANLFGAYSFVEDYLGCMKLSTKEDYIPQKKSLVLKDGYKKYEPAFDFRRTLFPGQFDVAYRDWYKLEDLDEWGSFVHTFNKLISPEDYFEEHPEYFSLISGRRLKDAQLCLSNPEVIQVLIENLGKEIAKKPEKKIWSVSQNDAINYCECDNCFALYEKYGNISGAYVLMANQIAEAYPDKIISTLAYQFTRSAPQNIKPLPNVNIMFCSIECNRSMPLVEDERSAEFVQEMKDWSKLTNNIFVWDYVVQFKNYLTPFPNFHVLQPNIQFFKESNVKMMFQQGSSRTWSDLAELKQYVIAKLLWNPDADVDALVKNFIKVYYGPASKYIQNYYDLTHKELIAKSKEQFLDIYGFPMSYTKAHLRPDLMIRYMALMDDAQKAVQDDEVYLDRVLRARLPVDFAYIDIAMNADFDELSMIEMTSDGKAVKPEMARLLNSLVSNSQRSDNIRVNERNFTTEAYREYVLNKLKRMVADNLIEDADVVVKTTYSETYPVGGGKAINDGLFGDLDFHNNWLGFEGHDMVLEIDMKADKTFSGIDMNFLKAVNSWVFLPVNVEIEISDDGEHYRHLINKKGDIEDQNYLVKSIPFEFRFDKETARYIRIKAESMKTCPDWHRGFGKPSWIFIDEVVVLK